MKIIDVVRHTWIRLTGLFLLPFGTIISISYLLYSLIIFKMPTIDDSAHALTKHSAKRIIGSHKGW